MLTGYAVGQINEYVLNRLPLFVAIMPIERVIVIGTSMGGIDALRIVVAGLPPDFANADLHRDCTSRPHAPGVLHQILGRAGSLPAFKVESALPLRAPGIYVAPPDFHLMVEKGIVRVTKGPRENRFRPAIDPLFRSADVTTTGKGDRRCTHG